MKQPQIVGKEWLGQDTYIARFVYE